MTCLQWWNDSINHLPFQFHPRTSDNVPQWSLRFQTKMSKDNQWEALSCSDLLQLDANNINCHFGRRRQGLSFLHDFFFMSFSCFPTIQLFNRLQYITHFLEDGWGLGGWLKATTCQLLFLIGLVLMERRSTLVVQVVGLQRGPASLAVQLEKQINIPSPFEWNLQSGMKLRLCSMWLARTTRDLPN